MLFSIPLQDKKVMELATFHKLTQEISLECSYMTESQKEDKLIQLIDLHQFVECFDPRIKILSYIHHSINIINLNNNKKGILFCDLKRSSVPASKTNQNFKKKYNISEMWFVFVEEAPTSNTAVYTDAIIENRLDIFYDKIFLFNFFQSIIHTLK